MKMAFEREREKSLSRRVLAMAQCGVFSVPTNYKDNNIDITADMLFATVSWIGPRPRILSMPRPTISLTSKQKSPLQKYSMIVFLFWLYLEKGITLKSSLSCKMYAEFCITVQWLMIRGHCQIKY